MLVGRLVGCLVDDRRRMRVDEKLMSTCDLRR